MTLSRQNVICGVIVIVVNMLLYTQTSIRSDAVVEGMQAMDYPKVLIVLLMMLGAGIIVYPSTGTEGDADIPLLSQRTCILICGLILYAYLLDVIGFSVSSFCMATLTSYTMGWRRLPPLLLCNMLGVAVIWALFRYVLKIPLPTGYLF